MRVTIEKLTAAVFAEFGAVLGEPADGGPDVTTPVCDCWMGVSDLQGIGSVSGRQITYLKIHTRPKVFDQMEKHETSAEAFIPLDGQSVLLVVPADAMDDQGRPDTTRARAFMMDGSQGILMKPGTWHAVPYPLTDLATYLVLVDDAIIPKNDLHVTAIEPIEIAL